MEFLENILNKKGNIPYDQRAKELLSLKEIMADILKEVIPEIFGFLTRKEIIDQCLTDPDNPENLHVTLLSKAERGKSREFQHIPDLLFKVKFPEYWFKSKKEKETVDFYLQNVESQKKYQSERVEEMRILIYLMDIFLNENEYLDFIEDASDQYKSTVPICTIWINYASALKNRYKTYRYRVNKEELVGSDYRTVKDYFLSSILAYSVNLGPEDYESRKDQYGMLRTLLYGKYEEVEDLFEEKCYFRPEKKKWFITWEEACVDGLRLWEFEKGEIKGRRQTRAHYLEKIKVLTKQGLLSQEVLELLLQELELDAKE